MSSKVFFYCLKVWLVSVLLGPALFWCCLMRLDTDATYTFPEFLSFWGLTILYGLAFSVISFLVFLFSMVYISHHQEWPVTRRRIVTALLGFVLLTIPIMIFLRTLNIFDPTGAALGISYLLPLLAGILFYRVP
jgi:hypothetical protein